jgi:hypothetical protein
VIVVNVAVVPVIVVLVAEVVVVRVVVVVVAVVVVRHWEAHCSLQSEQAHPSPSVREWLPPKLSKALLATDHVAPPRHCMAITEAVL